MITPVEFYKTAIQVVGESRVHKLQKINQAAAERMSALMASGDPTISSPVPPMGQTIHHSEEGAVMIVMASSGTGSIDLTNRTLSSEQDDTKEDTQQSPNDDARIDLAGDKSSEPILRATTMQPEHVADIPV